MQLEQFFAQRRVPLAVEEDGKDRHGKGGANGEKDWEKLESGKFRIPSVLRRKKSLGGGKDGGIERPCLVERDRPAAVLTVGPDRALGAVFRRRRVA